MTTPFLRLFGLERSAEVDSWYKRYMQEAEALAQANKHLTQVKAEQDLLVSLTAELEKKLLTVSEQRDRLNQENAVLHKTALAMQAEYTRVQKAYAEAEQAQASLSSALVECRQERERVQTELAEVKQAGTPITEPPSEQAADAAQGEEVIPLHTRGRSRKAVPPE